ncbi:PAS domain S-box-containing protein/diguanylate cyclase (GGDEF) domain-containing protein [Janthinobacterium psychrotolerans]|uniref:diguanylate cyclase n=2 Tax=Janthinobacterium psychrotolerans TaxID=1747903 RepID=A0A1A7C4X0_9BURK|nr:diguanylate cyclase [Janthinobacterium psychrotolerans]OBV40976.1 PAS domain S-box-containing protein/diguanylate cyclase (GGDEF) domain-containing protein [Janthinobacterium psychrotolerans]
MSPGSMAYAQRRVAAILIVDDAPANLELLRKLMSEQGYQVYVALSGERALAIAERAQPDLILLDVVMPDMDGFETCHQLKQNPLTRRIPVIFMSARTGTDDVVAGFDIGAVDYIGKPLRMPEVCARVRAQLQMRSNSNTQEEQAERLRTIVNHMAEGLLIIEADGRIQYTNPACDHYLGYRENELAGRSIAELLSPIVAQEYLDYFTMHAANPDTAHQHGTREVAIRHRDGKMLSMDLALTPMYLRQPLFIGLLHDITHHKQSEDALQRAAYLDPLTKIANRRHFDNFLDKEWQRAVRNGGVLSLVVLDVDHFKLYNDSLGHPAGDTCLQQVAQAIDSHACRAGDLAARYGGEEFVMLFSETEAASAMLLAETIRTHIEALHLPHPRSSTSPWITVSIGVATIRPHQLDSRETLFVAADRALYVAKEEGRNRVRATHSGSTAWETVKALVLR